MGLLSKKNKPSQKAYAVVTGAGSGIGRSFALELAKRGGDVICADIDLSSAQETVDLIQSMTSTSAYAVHCDVSQSRIATWQTPILHNISGHQGRTQHIDCNVISLKL